MVGVSLKDVTIPHEVFSHYGGAKVLLRPASPGTGIIAGKTVRAVLESQGIETGIHYPVPIHLQKACANLGCRERTFPVTEAAAKRILSLPMFPELNESQIERVADALAQALHAQSSVSGMST